MATTPKKVFIVTGANAGIGKEISRGIANQGHHVVMACRNEGRGKTALNDLVSSGISNDNLKLMIVDLASQQSIRDFVADFKSKYDRLDGLVNNAAIPGNEKKVITPEGFEEVCAANIISYFMLTHLLSDVLIQTGNARVVNVASHYAGSYDVNDLNWDKRQYDNNDAYQQSKQANRMLSWMFADKFKNKRVTVNACHPGVINTGLLKGLGFSSGKTPAAGADTPIWLATSPELEGVTGKWWDSRKEMKCHFRDPKQNKDLWNKMLEMTQLPDLNF